MKKLGVIVFGVLMVVGTLVCISAAGASDAELISFGQTVKQLAGAQLFGTPWTVAHQAPLSMGFSRQE